MLISLPAISCQALSPTALSSISLKILLLSLSIFFEKGLRFDKQPTPGERFGAGVEIGELVARGETEHDGARAGLNILFHPIDHFIPRAGNAKHRVGHRLVGPVVILGKKSLSFEESLLDART